jgi:hypothetical protein
LTSGAIATTRLRPSVSARAPVGISRIAAEKAQNASSAEMVKVSSPRMANIAA